MHDLEITLDAFANSGLPAALVARTAAGAAFLTQTLLATLHTAKTHRRYATDANRALRLARLASSRALDVAVN